MYSVLILCQFNNTSVAGVGQFGSLSRLASPVIYWSNVLTERFSIPYKNQTKEDTSF